MGGVAHAVGTLSDEEDFRDELEKSVAGMGFFLPLLLLAIAMFMVEGLLGSPSRPRKLRATAGEEQQRWDERPGKSPAGQDKEKKEVA
jgi:hypothetical protein